MANRLQEWLLFNLAKKRLGKFFFMSFFTMFFTLLTYYVLIPLVQLAFGRQCYFVAIFLYRGFIPYVIVICFWLMLGLLAFINLHISFEELAFMLLRNELSSASHIPKTLVYTNSVDIIKVIDDKKLAKFNMSLIFRRIRQGMHRLLNTQDTNALIDYFKLRSEIEYAEMESNFTEVKYFNWLIPTLGFIGTVLGIGVGIGGFAAIINTAENFSEVKDYLPSVTHNLGVAFDTTFLALILSVVGMFINSTVSKKNEKLMEEIDTFCLDDISSRFKIHSTTAEQLKGVFREIKEEITNVLQANQYETCNAVNTAIAGVIESINGLINVLSKNQGVSLDLSGVVMMLQKIEKQLGLPSKKESTETIPLSNMIDKLLKSVNHIEQYLKNNELINPKTKIKS